MVDIKYPKYLLDCRRKTKTWTDISLLDGNIGEGETSHLLV